MSTITNGKSMMSSGLSTKAKPIKKKAHKVQVKAALQHLNMNNSDADLVNQNKLLKNLAFGERRSEN